MTEIVDAKKLLDAQSVENAPFSKMLKGLVKLKHSIELSYTELIKPEPSVTIDCISNTKYVTVNGSVQKHVESIKNNVLHNTQYVYSCDSNNNETLISTIDYSNGDIDGLIRVFFPNEKLESFRSYVNNSQTGVGQSFYENGNLRQLTHHDDNVLVSCIEYYNNDNIKKLCIPDGTIEFYDTPDNQISATYFINKKDNHNECNVVRYHTQNRVKECFIEVNSEKNGQYTSFFLSGKPCDNCIFSDGLIIGSRDLYDENGNIQHFNHIYNKDTQLYNIVDSIGNITFSITLDSREKRCQIPKLTFE